MNRPFISQKIIWKHSNDDWTPNPEFQSHEISSQNFSRLLVLENSGGKRNFFFLSLSLRRNFNSNFSLWDFSLPAQHTWKYLFRIGICISWQRLRACERLCEISFLQLIFFGNEIPFCHWFYSCWCCSSSVLADFDSSFSNWTWSALSAITFGEKNVSVFSLYLSLFPPSLSLLSHSLKVFFLDSFCGHLFSGRYQVAS